MKTVGTQMLEENTSEEKSISNDVIRKLLGGTVEDMVIGVHFLYKKYPQLYDHTTPDGDEGFYVHERFIRECWPDFNLGAWSTPECIAKSLGLET